MIARAQLHQNMATLQTSLQRLSTGLRINSGKDDPAGLIASEVLRSDITGIKMAIKNTERANMMIATADSALNEVTNLLNDIRGLITEAANTGAMSAEMIAANQLQVDASLDAIDRIAAMTTFMGQKLLDGSLDFDKTGVNRNDLRDLSVHQVTFGADKSPIDVTINIQQPASKAELYYRNPAIAEEMVLQWGGNYGYWQESFQRGATVAEIARVVNATSNSTGVIAEVGSDAMYGMLYVSGLGPDNDMIIQAGQPGVNAGNIEIKYVAGSSKGVQVKYEEGISAGSPGKITVYLQTEEYKKSTADAVDNSWIRDPVTGKPVSPLHDNSALRFEANIPGSQYNNANIHYVDAQRTDASFADPNKNPAGSANYPYAKYNDNATSSVSLFGDVNGLGGSIGDLTSSIIAGSGDYFSIQSREGSSAYNNVEIEFVKKAAGSTELNGRKASAVYTEEKDIYGNVKENGKKLTIYFDDTGTATLQDVQDALRIERHEKDGGMVTGAFELKSSVPASSIVLNGAAAVDTVAASGNTHNSGGEAGTLFIYLPPPTGPDGISRFPAGHPMAGQPITANDIAALFDLDNNASKGSERAAGLFTVTNTVDNDGTGSIYLYDNIPGNVKAVTAFTKAFKGGVTGGDVITTAAELITVLNNSAYWGTMMCPEMIAELAVENADGKYYDLIPDKPVVMARLAPNNNGLQAVKVFEEVAYYGNPNEGTGLQFLGEKDSPSIRFVAEPGNSQLWIDRTTVPASEGLSQAVLTAQEGGASLTITAVKKGGDYDDVQFVFKRINEDVLAVISPDRADGWVEYDPGVSQAEAHAVFRDATSSTPVANTGFYIKATERGDMYNNVAIQMRLDDTMADIEDGIQDGIVVKFDSKTNSLQIAIDSTKVGSITANDVIAAINNAKLGFTAELSFAEDINNTGLGTFDTIGLSTGRLTEIANTGTTGGHKGGTVTVWLADEIDGVPYIPPTQDDIVRLINNDPVVGRLFTAKAYNTVETTDSRQINFVKDGPIVSQGGLIQKAVITVHLVTDQYGLVQTTAKDLQNWWNAQDPAYVENISVSIVRPQGAQWDACDDPYGYGILKPTVSLGDCNEIIVNDIQFVGWNDNAEQQNYVAKYSTGTMTSQRGINSSYQLIARQLGPDWDGYTIRYINDDSLTGRYADNVVAGSSDNPCDGEEYNGLKRDDCGNLITPVSGTENGMRLVMDPITKEITIYVKFGATTASDIEQLIENDVRTRNYFSVNQLGDGTGLINLDDNTLLTTGGAIPPGNLNGAKLIQGADASDYFLIFKSQEYGSDKFVDVRAYAPTGGTTSFTVQDSKGKTVEKTYGQDVLALVNGVKAVGRGLNASLNTSILSLDFTLSEDSGTDPNYSSTFTINGGGATYQIGPDVVSNQQITLGIQSVNTAQLGGASGKLYQLRSGQDASLTNDTNKAFRIVQESILSITQVRGRLGTIQKATFDTNINVLNDTLQALTEAESQIRDADFAEETANLTRAQILVQAGINSLGIANQLPQYVLSLLGR